jgi:hypothetical protein
MATRKSDIFDLSNYESEADKEYKSYKVRLDADTVVTLRNPFLISEEKRNKIFDLVASIQTDKKEETTSEDVKNVTSIMLQMLELVGDHNVQKLIDRIDGNLPVIKNIFEDYMETVQLGEASSSES